MTNPIDDAALGEAAALFKVLSDPNRLRIFNVLMAGDTCNCEMAEMLDTPANLLSHHLRVLRKAGLISSRRDSIDGRWIYYSVNKEAVTRWHGWLSMFFDPARVQKRKVLCGPEGDQARMTESVFITKEIELQ